MRAGQVAQRKESNWESHALDFESYAADFALCPEAQAEVARHGREDVARNAAMQAAIEAKKIADEIERAEKGRIEKDLKEATAAKLKERRRPQQGERVEYQVLRSAPDDGQPWPNDDEIRVIRGKDPRVSGTVYGQHFAIRFTHKQMGPTPVLLADAPGETAQAELREHNPFALRSSTSSSTLPTQAQAECSVERDSSRVAGSLLRDPRKAKQLVVGGLVSSSTDPMEAPAKLQSTATPGVVRIGVDEQLAAPTRDHSF